MKILGIISLVLVIVAIFTPGMSLYLTWAALVLATLAAFSRDGMTLAILTVVVGLLNLVLLSPFALAAHAMPLILVTSVVLFPAPLLVALLRGLGFVFFGGGRKIKIS